MTIAVRRVCALLHVFDMPASLRFYRDALGFAVPYGMKQLHLADPDGYGLCFQQPASTI